MSDPKFEDPRLASLYDEMCAGREDTGFYVALAGRLGARRVADLGCGTGVLAGELAARGYDVVGVDPAGAMLDVARSRPCGDSVRWLLGDAAALPAGRTDLVVMNGHVAQVFLDEESWTATLRAIHCALRPGGHLAFELRNPAARAWEAWNPVASRVRLAGGDLGPVTAWTETETVSGEHVTFTWRYELERTGEVLESTSTLRFPPLPAVKQSLADAGFEVAEAWGDWDGSPITATSPEWILLTTR